MVQADIKSTLGYKIGFLIGKTLGYTCKIALYSTSTGGKVYASYRISKKVVNYTVQHYKRTDFSSTTIFNDSVDAVFGAY